MGSSKYEGEPVDAKSVDQSCFSRSRHLTRELDRGLHRCFQDIQVLSQLINSSHGSGEKLSDIVVEGFLTSIQSRLLLLDFRNHHWNPLAEILRLSLHAYLTTVFWNFPGLKTQYPYIAAQFREACLIFSPANTGESFLFAWALMVGAVSLFHGQDQEWLMERLYPLMENTLGIMWLEVKCSLCQAMWIESLHDGPGIEVFSRYVRERKGGSAGIASANWDAPAVGK